MEQGSADSIRQFAEKYTAAWCSQDPDRVAACYSEDGSLAVNDDTPAVGRKAIAEVARGFMIGFPDMQVLFDDLVLQPEGALYHWTLIGTNNGSGGSGRSVRISGCEVWRIGTDGLIAESQGHFDEADYRRQLGPEF